MDIDSEDGGGAGMNVGAAQGDTGVMGEVDMTAAVTHMSELGSDKVGVIVDVDCSWCSFQCTLTDATLSLFVSSLGFGFFAACRLHGRIPPGRKNASCTSLYRYRRSAFSLTGCF